MLRAKVDPAVTGRLWRRAERVVLTTPASDRALPPAELAERVGATDVEVIPTSDAALERALAVTAPDLLVVSGSIYLVGEMRSALRRRYGVPPEPTSLFGSS